MKSGEELTVLFTESDLLCRSYLSLIFVPVHPFQASCSYKSSDLASASEIQTSVEGYLYDLLSIEANKNANSIVVQHFSLYVFAAVLCLHILRNFRCKFTQGKRLIY